MVSKLNVVGAIFPTHTCFDDVMDFVLKIKPELQDMYTPVQGIRSIEGKLDPHAWIECGDKVIDFGKLPTQEIISLVYQKDDFYTRFGITKTYSYTVPKYNLAAKFIGISGPFHVDLYNLIKKRKRASKEFIEKANRSADLATVWNVQQTADK